MMLKQRFQNEDGNIALFVLGMLSLIMILLIFVVNLGGALATKEQSGTTVQQASMAASSVLYEEVQRVVYEYEDETLEGALQTFFEDIDQMVDERVEELSSMGNYADWTSNEIELEAFDQVLSEELNKDVVRSKLIELLEDEDIETEVINTTKNAIVANEGVLEGAQLTIRNDRFHVRAANELESVSFDGYMEGIQENVYQESAGPKIDFLDVVWDGDQVIALD
ncbi:Putative Flp pilus-assembly TadE/G-like [Lentibacillus halodurans]|uniref:Putative Flp pilus-assembly TadE/G-like n=1 Tax=Lentibacillus halodurans TaxID=237679 RepID=A0A1I0WQU4_9BACI|nr:Tad domain-containing protein [Lentibacillus halodurans]SFA91132.1 Putative Flp pilus-assembly TadE/G-like [Lentibacillus halodurans]